MSGEAVTPEQIAKMRALLAQDVGRSDPDWALIAGKRFAIATLAINELERISGHCVCEATDYGFDGKTCPIHDKPTPNDAASEESADG